MKKIKLYTVLALSALVMSCEDAIDIQQPGLLDANAAFQSVSDLNDGLLGAYNSLDITPEMHFTSVFTDEIRIGFDNGGQGQSLYRFQLNPGNAGPSVIWTRGFQGITRATRVIVASESLLARNDDNDPNNDVDAAAVANIVGQAYAVRAYINLQMLSYYSPNMSDSSSLGIPIVDFVAGTDFLPTRATTGDSFDFIQADLQIAANQITAQSSLRFFSKDAVDALRARAYAYRGQYGSAEPLASRLLAAYPLAATQDAYEAIFRDTGNAEVIMKLERTVVDTYNNQGATGSSAAGGWGGANYAFTGPGINGSPYYEVATDLALTVEPGDRRSAVIYEFFPNFSQAGRDVYTVNKYRGSEGQPLMNDHKIFRSSEMLLILAEAAAANNNTQRVTDLIDDLRDSRYGADVADKVVSNQTQAYGLILDERRLEFAFEGHRYNDLRRLGALGNRSIDRAAEDCASFGACDLPISDFRFTWPIPQAEFNGNPGLRAQQNPGY
ncbi:RagB/SusD family nutrient uptake outer membrane protein [Nonlabens marinus]|uniref:Putative outer membrane protein, probably involved in nutrient binding n=1 Tax=Nonlabens marinus S1-08 TaxID=1454201 RepID=W8VVX5_9FLAO|nr:RagB/SusD family nutrient uptake outer membrane protein [Nonlabens marinus]BAO54252.1 putative outer membrane protein, probably involved in nutrient binding [Nonlabens marinus S1-08]